LCLMVATSFTNHAKGRYVPVTETDFSKDPTFGFSHYRLAEWVEEKSKGAWRASQVLAISLNMLREGGPDEVAALLAGPNTMSPSW